MRRRAVKTLGKKAPKIRFPAATGKKKHKKKSSLNDIDDDALKLMRKQLAAIGCKLHEVEADGNCLFRALGDQLFGDQQQHDDVREKIVDYIVQHRPDFEPFMEDEEKFEKYCDRMREDGTWGGNQELYAAARLFQVYVVVHQDQPSARIMVIECDQLKPTRFIHIAYHGEDHYDSVRAIADSIESNSLPMSIKLDCDGFRFEHFAKRWQTYEAENDVEAEDEQDIVPKLSTDPVDDQVDQSANCLGEQLQVSLAGLGNGGATKALSKKEQRQMRKAERAVTSSAQKL